MLRFIFNNWKRNRSRFIPMMIGVLIISSGLGYIAGVQETNKGTIEEILQKRWKASYDIVVKPTEATSITEEAGLLEPNYQNGIAGGISFEQFEIIKSMEEIEVAAPIAVLGHTQAIINLDRVNKDITEPGVYKVIEEKSVDNGAVKEKQTNSYYFTNGLWLPDAKRLQEYGVDNNWYGAFGASINQLLVAIDPVEEQKLVDLEGAIVPDGGSRYFQPQDKTALGKGGVFNSAGEEVPIEWVKIPVLVSNGDFSKEDYTFRIEKLDLPFSDFDIANKTMRKVLENGGASFLDEQPSKAFKEYHYDSEVANRILIGNLTGVDPVTKEDFYDPDKRASLVGSLFTKVSPLEFSETRSPFPEKWQNAYTIKPFNIEVSGETLDGYREHVPYAEETVDLPPTSPYFVGLFDPKKLKLSMDPLTELPMETYRPAAGKLVLNKEGKPINPPKTITSENNPLSFLTSPPGLLTTLDATKELMKRTPAMGDKPISVIRIKVSGVNSLSEKSQAKLEKIASKIEDVTGLNAEITLGSSPQPVLTYIPKSGSKESLGWIEQAWVKIGTAISIYTESKLGYSSMVSIVILVAMVYVFSSNLVSFLARKKELALLISLGWRHSQILKMLFLESLLVGIIASILSGTFAFVSYSQSNVAILPIKYLLIGLLGFIIYTSGAIWPALLAWKIKPYEALRSGEMLKKSVRLFPAKGIVWMALGHLFGKIKRNSLALISIMLPTALLLFFIFVTFRLQGILFTTWLGQYVSLEIGKAHYVAIAVALLVAILTTFQIMWQNVTERIAEIALLKSVGWRNRSIRFLILIEGVLIGVLAGLIGYGVGLICIQFIYQQFPYRDLWLVLVMVVPIIVGLLGSIIPAELSVRTTPIQGINGGYHEVNSRGAKVSV
jgi:ABC-type antimicrobial peptide transport system permease subunit